MSEQKTPTLRELDAQIAERIYGLPVTWREGKPMHIWDAPNFGKVIEEVEPYTASRREAMKLAEHLQREGWLVNIKLMPLKSTFIAFEQPLDVRACVELRWMRRGSTADTRKYLGLNPTAVDNSWKVALVKAALQMVELCERFGAKETSDGD